MDTPTTSIDKAPICCNREMWAVMDRRTSSNAISREHDTPVWWCCECHNKIVRKVNA